jgi:hypothetical protein
VLSKSLELGSCGAQWMPPDGAIGVHTETELVVSDDTGLRWRIRWLPTEFAIAAGEEAALSEDVDTSARAAFEARWRQQPRAAGARPRTESGEWSPIVEAKLGAIGPGRLARVVRRLAYEQGDEVVIGHLFIPVEKGTVEIRVMAQSSETGLRENAVATKLGGRQPQATYDAREVDPYFPDHPLTRVRAALDGVIGSLEIVTVPDRPAEITLPEPGCAVTAPLRFVAAPTVVGSGRGELVRLGVDDWQRTIEVWRIGRHSGAGQSRLAPALKGKDTHAALVEHANKTAEAWSADGGSNIVSHSAPIDDFGMCLQIQQYVTLDRDDESHHAVYRWWIAGDGTLWRIGETSTAAVDREVLAADVAAVQDSFRRI